MKHPDRPYPHNLAFLQQYYKDFSERLRPVGIAFFDGGILDELDSRWNNVFHHCLVEAIAVDVLLEHLEKIPEAKKLITVERDDLILAAFVHDAYKRREIEEMRSKPRAIDTLYHTDQTSQKWLRRLGYPEQVVQLQRGIGNNAAKDIYLGIITSFPERLLQYIDDITQDDRLVTLEERLSSLEQNPKYQKQNEWSRRYFDGITLYGAKRIFNRKTEQELAALLRIENHTTLPDWITAHIHQRCITFQKK